MTTFLLARGRTLLAGLLLLAGPLTAPPAGACC